MSRIESDMTDSARAIEEIAKTLETLAESVIPLEEMAEQHAGIARSLAAIPDMVKALGTLTSEVMNLGSRLNTYVDSTATNDGRLRARVTALETVLGQR